MAWTSMITMLRALLFVMVFLIIGSSSRPLLEDLKEAPRFPLNLDLPEEERWKPILQHWDIGHCRSMIEQVLSNFFSGAEEELLIMIGSAMHKFIPAPYAGEMTGIANYLQLNVGQIMMVNFLYDITAAMGCTSIVAQDSEGNIWHARNFDYDFTEMLKNLSVVVDFQSKGKTLYTGTVSLGQIGLYTAQRPNGFTASFNQRDQGTVVDNLIQIIFALVTKKAAFTSLQIRNALMRNYSYDSVVNYLAKYPETTPNYFIVGGSRPREGAVITRNRNKAVDVWRLSPANGRWYVLETNYDHWKPAPSSDNRRGPAKEALDAIGPEAIDLNGLLQVLSVHPVCNSNTVYTTLMSAADPSRYVTYIRNC